ncbi:g7405 [Coccomyxa viridis]|uniref:G7405 protein n=1 Tax=Coccomyxa viridis TaxID=1274662 RepID=A0ABP1FYW8_9CHLO
MSSQTAPTVLDRIRERDEQRQAALQTREGSSLHCQELARKCADLEHMVKGALAAAERALKGSKIPDLETTAEALSSYEKAVAGACSHLPTYEAQQLHAHVKGFKEQLLELRAQGAPKRRFSFARKPAPTETAGAESGKPDASAAGSKACVEEGAQKSIRNAPDSAISLESSREMSEKTRSSAVAANTADDSTRCISERMHETIQHALEGDGGPLVIRDLTFCTVCIRGRVEALRMRNLNDCTVIAGPVHGSAFIEGVESSTVILHCNQARIHRSTDTTFLLRVISNPIIEHSTRLRFGSHPGRAQQDCDNGMWRQVQDFGWLRSTPSPNWTVMGNECDLSAEIIRLLELDGQPEQ